MTSQSQSQPASPFRVPKTATTYSPATQDPDLRSQINTSLLRDGHVQKIQSHLSQSLAAHPSNWPSRVGAHALLLLRSGECTTFPQLMERVLADVRRDTDDARRVEEEARSSEEEASEEVQGGMDVKSSSSSSETLLDSVEGSNDNCVGSGSTETLNGTAIPNGIAAAETGTSKASKTTKGKGKGKGKGKDKGKAKEGLTIGVGTAAGGEDTVPTWGVYGLAVPKVVVDEGVRVTRECLELICEIEE